MNTNKFTLAEKTKALIALFFLMLFAAMPAQAAGFGEIFTTLADQSEQTKTALKIICPVLAFVCIIGAGFIFWKRSRSNGGEQVKLVAALFLILGAIVFSGATWILNTAADSVGAEVTTF